MKRKILFIFLLLLVPTFVFAKDTCNNEDIKIKSIVLKDTNGFSEEVQEASINNNTMHLNLKMYNVGDSANYNITIGNNSDEEYYFTNDSFKMNTDYLEYSLVNNCERIPAKSEKMVELKVTYKNKIPNESYSDTNKLKISLSDNLLENSKTNSNSFVILILLFILIPISIKYHKKGLLLLSILAIVSNVYAVCNFNLNIEPKIEIVNKEAVFLPGTEVNVKMKQLAGTIISNSTYPFITNDYNIASIKYSEIEPTESNKEEKNIVSIEESPYPIYMWYTDGTIYWWSEDEHPSLNSDASYMFAMINSLNDIESVADFDVEKTTSLESFFVSTAISNLSPLSNWNISNVQNIAHIFQTTNIQKVDSLIHWNTQNITNMAYIFCEDKILEDVSAIKNWDVSNVRSMSHMFDKCYSLETINLSNWTTSSLENISGMFGMFFDGNNSVGKLKQIVLSEKFDTSNVTDMSYFLYHNINLENYSFLKYLDVSNIKNFNNLFTQNNNLKSSDLVYIKNWNTSNAIDMSYMFSSCVSLTSLAEIEKWNVSNVTSFANTFCENYSLEDASAINNWNISPTASFYRMFRNTPSHPEFSKVPGTWDINGTFTPTT